MCGAPGASVGANARQWGVESRQGAENSALKNIAPFSRTPFNTSENASIFLRLSPDALATFRGARAKHSKPQCGTRRGPVAYGRLRRMTEVPDGGYSEPDDDTPAAAHSPRDLEVFSQAGSG